MLALVAVFLLSANSSALAEKVALSHTNGRIMPASVFVVGTYDEKGRPDIALIDRAGIASAVGAEKIFVYVSVNPSRQTAKNINGTGSFTINIPNDGNIRQADLFGSFSGLTKDSSSNDVYQDKIATTGLIGENYGYYSLGQYFGKPETLGEGYTHKIVSEDVNAAFSNQSSSCSGGCNTGMGVWAVLFIDETAVIF